jgi:hypothetical protein
MPEPHNDIDRLIETHRDLFRFEQCKHPVNNPLVNAIKRKHRCKSTSATGQRQRTSLAAALTG